MSIGLSDNFSQDEKCMQVYELTTKILKNDYLLVEFGPVGAHSWLQDTNFAHVCGDVRVVMQEPKRLQFKFKELLESVERNIGDIKIERGTEAVVFDVFISYCWKNSHDAVAKGTKGTETGLGALDPRTLPEFFKSHGINAWIDCEELPVSANLFGEITKVLI